MPGERSPVEEGGQVGFPCIYNRNDMLPTERIEHIERIETACISVHVEPFVKFSCVGIKE